MKNQFFFNTENLTVENNWKTYAGFCDQAHQQKHGNELCMSHQTIYDSLIFKFPIKLVL